jgi:hypothetical protein
VKKKVKKLTLSRETLLSLETGRLQGIAGAATLAPGCATYSPRCTGGSNECSADTCTQWTVCMSCATCALDC